MGGTRLSGEFLEVRQDRNVLHVFGDLRLSTLPYMTAGLHRAVDVSAYRDITIDLTSLSSIQPSVVPPLAAYMRRMIRDVKVDFSVLEPRSISVRSKLQSLGLLHYLDHRKYAKPKPNSSDPALLQFMNHDEREVAVDKVMNSALRTSRLDRRQTAALDWAVNEITDNVLSHAKSPVGGFLICNKIPKTNIIEFTVADSGIGVARSLGITDDTEAVEKAIQEGVTRNKSTNQGNGLFGTYRLSLISRGIFVLKSRNGNLFVEKDGGMHIRRDGVPFPGTYVVCQIDCDDPDLIERALSFSDIKHTPPFDYIERKHEQGTETPVIKAVDICKTFGSRSSGQEARTYILNVISGSDTGSVKIDFSDIHVVSSSFADEVFGKLFVELGPMTFMRSIDVVNAVSTVSGLIDRAIVLRSKTGL